MPLSSIDPDDLMVTVHTLTRLRAQLDVTDEELLGQHVALGDRDADQIIEGWIDHLADTLRAVNELAQQQTLLLRNVAATTVRTETEARQLIEHHDR